jgi:hypothetical protein
MTMMNKYPPVITTPLFWDCNCDDNYIRPTGAVDCLFCGAQRDESPDSRLNEVIRMLVKDWSRLTNDFPLDLSDIA